MAMDYFPVFLDLRGRRCLVVGGGEPAAAKAALLARAGAEVAIIAAALGPTLRCAVRSGRAIHLAERFVPSLLEHVALVVVASERLDVSDWVAQAAQARGIPVNVIDEAALSSCIMPSIVDRSPVIVAVSTGGTAPLLAQLLRHWLDCLLPARLGKLAALAGHFRPLVKRRLPDRVVRHRFWQQVLTGEAAGYALAGEDAAAGMAVLRALDDDAKAGGQKAAWAERERRFTTEAVRR
jgi:uroporphyrin-III C-methyltransferase/precorrin-2 dehydrogenase/sirohydrochlorin ferrochelatase